MKKLIINFTQMQKAWSMLLVMILFVVVTAKAQTTEFNYTGVIQNYTVPAGVTKLSIEALGAQGGNDGGRGAHMKGVFNVTPGQQLRILVGQRGFTNFAGVWNVHFGSGGGGGTFVTTSGNTPLIVAGGGGGNVGIPNEFMDAVTSNSGQRGFSINITFPAYGLGGVNGNGAQNAPTGQPHAGNGGGFFSSGQFGQCGQPGNGFLQGGAGGAGCTLGAFGGFGGGGGGGNAGGGGGGGYSGGGGSYHFPGNGGGGGSFNGGQQQVNIAAANIGHGKVIIRVVEDTPTITCATDRTNYCEGSSGTINYTITGTFNPGNIFTAQLSDAAGSFAMPMSIGSTASTSSGSIGISIPVNISSGNGYRVRVVSSTPAITGASNLSPLVIDNADPVISTQQISVSLNAQGTYTLSSSDVAAITAGTSDACGIASVAIVPNVFNCSHVGLQHVEVRVTDHVGHVFTAPAQVLVQDNVAPVVLVKPVTIQLNEQGTATITVADVNNGSSDACGIAAMSINKTTFTCDDIGTGAQQPGSTTFNSSGFFTVPQGVTELRVLVVGGGGGGANGHQGGGGSGYVRTGVIQVTPGQQIPVAVGAGGLGANANISNNIIGITPGAPSSFGSLIAQGGQVVTVINGVGNDGGSGGGGSCNAGSQGGAGGTGGNNGGSCTYQGGRGQGLYQNLLAIFTNASIVPAPGGAGGTSSHAGGGGGGGVFINGNGPAADSGPRTWSGRGGLGFGAGGGAGGYDGPSGQTREQGGRGASGIVYVEWDATNSAQVTLTVEDVHGNIATAVTSVIVEDHIAPTVNVKNITVQLDANGNASIDASAIDDGSFDACGIESMAINRMNFTCDDLGDQTVTLTVTDKYNNTTSKDAVVTVADNLAPTVVTQGITVQLSDEGISSIEAEQVIESKTDNCSIASVVISKTTFTCDDVGINTIDVTVTDQSGNATTVPAEVLVEDNTAPEMLGKALTVDLDHNGFATISPSDVDGGSSDACGIQSLTVSQSSFDCTMLGENVVALTAVDLHNNQSTVQVVVTVRDVEAPAIAGLPGNISVSNDPGKCGAVVSWNDVGATDNCSAVLTSNISSGSYFGIGTTTVTYTATEASGNTVHASFDVTVADDESPVISGMPSNQVLLNDAGTCSAVVSWNAPTASDNCAGVVITQTAGPVSGSAFPQGVTTVTYEAEDAAGNTTTSSFSVTVNNTVPVITELQTPIAPVALGSLVTLSAKHNDDNLVSAIINWGDGSSTSANIAANGLTGSHVYSSAGVYSVSVTVVDACNATATATQTQYVVIYDANGGFVTGGGWFYSGEGAYAPNPSATGKATFGFVSKYKKGSSVPEGNTDFQFNAANLKFKSTAYEWLVIAGYKAMYKGVGEVNGMGGYGFLISAVDGGKKSSSAPDNLRVKIWDGSGSVIYDNQRGDSDNADASTQLGGGSIVIHSSEGRNATNARTTHEQKQPEGDDAVEILSASTYPNPFRDVITVHYASELTTDVAIDVVTLQGKNVYAKSHFHNSSGIYVVDLTGASLTSNVYILLVKQGQRKGVFKVFRK